MDLYRKFVVSMTALMIEVNRTSGKAEKGMVPIDARLLNEAVRLTSASRDSMNNHLEFKLGEERKRLRLRYKLEDSDGTIAEGAFVSKPEDKPVAAKGASPGK